jgi:hypothetical protein
LVGVTSHVHDRLLDGGECTQSTVFDCVFKRTVADD